jgi:DNA replication and repair protein RecF
LLKSAAGKLTSNHLVTLDAWNENLVKYGIDIMIRRLELLDTIKDLFANRIKSFFNNIVAEIKYIYSWDRNEKKSLGKPGETRSGYYGRQEDLETEKDILSKTFKKRLVENLDSDLLKKSTAVGPHRDDIAIFFNGKDIRSFGSQGQQRAAAISLKLCEIQVLKDRLKTDPVLLLDDVLSELDIERRKKLVGIISGRFQTFVTATNISYLDKLDIDFGSRFLVKEDDIIKMDF